MAKKSKQTKWNRIAEVGIGMWLKGIIVDFFSVVFGVATAYAGYMRDVPLMWLMMAGALAFAGIANGMLHVSNWREKNTARGKLILEQVNAISGFTSDETEERVAGAQVAFVNTAHFPIEWQITSVDMKFANTVPADSEEAPSDIVNVTLPKNRGLAEVGFVRIPEPKIVTGPNKSIPDVGAIHGKLFFTVQYGKEGAMNHTIERRYKIVLMFNEMGHFVQSTLGEEPV